MADAVGDWQQATAARALPPAMATKYNDDRVLMAADVKTRLLTAVGQQARALNRTTVSGDEIQRHSPGKIAANDSCLSSDRLPLRRHLELQRRY